MRIGDSGGDGLAGRIECSGGIACFAQFPRQRIPCGSALPHFEVAPGKEKNRAGCGKATGAIEDF
jgi:hypothetical protein